MKTETKFAGAAVGAAILGAVGWFVWPAAKEGRRIPVSIVRLIHIAIVLWALFAIGRGIIGEFVPPAPVKSAQVASEAQAKAQASDRIAIELQSKLSKAQQDAFDANMRELDEKHKAEIAEKLQHEADAKWREQRHLRIEHDAQAEAPEYTRVPIDMSDHSVIYVVTTFGAVPSRLCCYLRVKDHARRALLLRKSGFAVTGEDPRLDLIAYIGDDDTLKQLSPKCERMPNGSDACHVKSKLGGWEGYINSKDLEDISITMGENQ